MHQHGVTIESYHGDNGVYHAKDFVDLLSFNKQRINYCVGAHHQNGIAERVIQTISNSARTMLLHGAIYWPAGVSMDLWPFANSEKTIQSQIQSHMVDC